MQYSNFYGRYKNARNAAWEMLLSYNLNTLPIKVLDLAKALKIKVGSYKKAERFLNELNLSEHCIGNDGFSLLFNNQWFIFYDRTILPKERIRFTIAHEIGHIVLGHHMETQKTLQYRVRYTKTNSQDSNLIETDPLQWTPIESEANIFASRLLAPACVLAALDITQPDQIMQLCGLSRTAAKIRSERMHQLIKRNKFGASPLEVKVIELFRPFIEAYKKE